MDHLPAILRPFNPIKVPYLGGAFGKGNFSTYPQDQGFSLARLQENDFHSNEHEEGSRGKDSAAKMLQAWLCFGLLRGVLQLDIKETDFVDDNFITSIKLRSLLSEWRQDHEEAKMNPSYLKQRKEKACSVLKISHTARYAFNDFTSIVGPEIELSIHLLASALEHAVTSVSATPSDHAWEPWIHVNEAPWRRTPNTFVEERLRGAGWCPSIVKQLGRPTKLGL